MILILQNLDPTAISLKSWDSFFIVQQELYKYIQFNLLVTLYDSIIIVLPA